MSNKTTLPVRRVVYSFVVADLFHYGHLQLLKTAREAGDYHVCGVLSDEAAAAYRAKPISNFNERLAVISELKCVDRVIVQDSKDPTENLKAIHIEFPAAEIILVHGNDWENIPGRPFVESIGGKVFQPEYYRRLADRKIKSELFSSEFQNFELFTEHFQIDGITYFQRRKSQRIISTKADTLKQLRPLLKKSRIEESFVFRVGDWKSDYRTVIAQVRENFSDKIVVRSSAVNEDTEDASMAGYYESVLHVSSRNSEEVRQAVEKVLGSYASKGDDNDYNQILVQTQTPAVNISGVIFTHVPGTGASYYLLNYDDVTGKTDTVTSGGAGKLLHIARSVRPADLSKPWREIILAVREIERLIPGLALDIEFGLDSCGVVIYQVRPLVSVNRLFSSGVSNNNGFSGRLKRMRESFLRLSLPREGEAGEFNVFSDMAFWNPAEIIGNRGNFLAHSLYRLLITSGPWNTGLLPFGYTEVRDKELMVSFAGKGYIDLRKTFNALIPSGITGMIRKKLVEGALNRVCTKPELHDKIEFEVLDSSFLFDLEERRSLYTSYGLENDEFDVFCSALKKLTRLVVQRYPALTAEDDRVYAGLYLRREEILRRSRRGGNGGGFFGQIVSALELLEECRRHGTAIFARQARSAFIAKALLLSMKRKAIIDDEYYAGFLQSLYTVASILHRDHERLQKGEMSMDSFMNLYRHLRPNTYDITSLRYDRMPPELLAGRRITPAGHGGNRKPAPDGIPGYINMELVDHLLNVNDFGFGPEQIFSFMRQSLENRERFKFEFTKNISDALELIAGAGEEAGLSREKLACISIEDFMAAGRMSGISKAAGFLRARSEKNRRETGSQAVFLLPALIRSEKDFYIIPQLAAKPNFITRGAVEGEVVVIRGNRLDSRQDLEGRIVVIESADPGYDWIFTKGILALVTKFGGVASHMAIRCSEFGLPAAIGCGDDHYNRLMSSGRVRLDCGKETITFIE